jgi:predicted phage-related endonuclease
MSVQINEKMCDLDATAAAWLEAYIEAKSKMKEYAEKADRAQEQVKAALGDCEIGLVNGREAIRWTTVESKRVDVTKLRALLPPQVLDLVEITSVTRRFSIVQGDE